jgi:hypothetical protein
MVMFLHHLLLDHRLLALNKPSHKLVITDMEILLHSKGVVRSKVRVILGLALTHGNDDFATRLHIQGISWSKGCFGR